MLLIPIKKSHRTIFPLLILVLFFCTNIHAEEVTLPAFLESVTLPSGEQYDGQLVKGVPNGRGLLLKANGDQYNGIFVDGKFEGRGVFHWIDGGEYKGKWVQNKRQGFGSMQYANGNHYEGEWLAGKRHGRGQLTFRSGTRYEGQWKSDLKNGEGMLIYRSGQRYIGKYKNDLRHGKGVLVRANGESYRGTFSKDKEHGVGECSTKYGNVETCLFNKGKRITKRNLVERAAAYQKNNAPTYEFQGGIGFVFEDGFTKKRRYLQNENVWWESKVALLSTELRIRSEGDNQFIHFIIREYDGVGKYHIKKGDLLIAIEGSDPLELPEASEAIIEITSEHKGVIEGKFTLPSLTLTKNNAVFKYTVRNGQLEASNSPVKK